MAEALVEVTDPLAALLSPGPELSLDEVRRSLAASLAPAEADVAAPAWLQPEQIAPFRRVLAGLTRHGGALLADPVGSGKTWIALAVAGELGETVAVVPASLREQWRRTSTALGVPLAIHTHEALSRGRLPPRSARLVIVDESHRFRTPDTRRYQTLSRWVVGKQVLLLSATPVVNRLADLAHQLRLGVRDDALAGRGVPNLRRLLESGETSPALGDVVLCRPRPPERPAVRARIVAWEVEAIDHQVLEEIDRLKLSSNRATRALLRMVLWRAMASSRAALMAALRRYRALLEHASQAAAIGKAVSRNEIRAFTMGELDQLVLWEVLPSLATPADLVLEDRPALDQLLITLRSASIDPRATALSRLVADRRVTLVFTTSRDTLELLRAALSDLRPAWVTGGAAGIGHVRLERELVLDLFRPPAAGRIAVAESSGPTVLLATDVAAEGLDLQRAERIVHFDLPWTSVRVDQREGRAVRMGSDRTEVEVVRLAAWEALEERLRQDSRLVTKRRLVTQAGLDDTGHWLFRWRAEVADAVRGAAVQPGIAMGRGATEGWLIGLALDLVLPDGRTRREPAGLFWVTPAGEIVEDAKLVADRLESLAVLEPGCATEAEVERAGQVLRNLARLQIEKAQATSWLAREAATAQRSLVRRMRRVAAEAARRRNRPLLQLADRALDWLAGGVTAGEESLMADLVSCPVPRLAGAWCPLLTRPRLAWLIVPRLTGIIGVSNFPACPPSIPCCSTSTAR